MNTLIIISFCALFISMYARHKYIQYKKDKEFWESIEKMRKSENQIFIDALEKTLEKTLEEMKPFIVDIYKKKKGDKNEK